MPRPQTIVVAHRSWETGMMPVAAPRRRTSWPGARNRRWRTLIVVFAGLAVPAAAAILLFVHPTYRVRATLQVAPRGTSGPGLGLDAANHYQQYVATEVMTVASRSVLGDALKAPEARSSALVPGAVDRVAQIGKRLSIAPIAGTQLIEIAMTGDHPRDMTAIVNAVAQAYLRHRDGQERSREAQVVQALTKERRALQDGLAANTAQREEAGTAPDAPPVASVATIDARMAELRQGLVQLEQTRARAVNLLDTLRTAQSQDGAVGGDPEELERFLAKDDTLRVLKTELSQIAGAALLDERTGRLPGHPDLRSKLERMTVLRRRIRRREGALRDPYLTVTTQRLLTQLDDISVSTTVIAKELDTLSQQRVLAARRTRRLDELQSGRRHIEQDLSRVRQKIREVALAQRARSYVAIHEPAKPPAVPNVDRRPLYTAVAVALSLLVGTGVTLIRHRRVADLCDPGEIAQRLGISVLGSVQYLHQDQAALHAVDQRLLESIRGGTAPGLAPFTAPARSRLVTSPQTPHGKSAFAADLARSLSARGQRVLLIDADPERRAITREMDLLDRPGLAEWLDRAATIDQAMHDGDTPHLSILPAGRGDARLDDRLRDWRAQAALRSLFEGYDEVIVDAPPVLATGKARPSAKGLLMAGLVDEVILVVQPEKTTERQARLARRFLAAAGVHVVGVIVNTPGT